MYSNRLKSNFVCIVVGAFFSFSMIAQSKVQTVDSVKSSLFSSLVFRSIGPAVVSGRIADFAVNPQNSSEYYVAVASGGVWKTNNKGLTYSPIFDSQGSYSIGCVSLDPSNSSTIWVGTGENNNQRSVAFGDGVYKSDDGGKTWKNMGLKNSEHIGKIVIHPTNSNIIYVAAYGPLWNEGGERGVYKSIDGGLSWNCVKSVSAYTGCNEIVMDPRNPEVLYAAFHQRMRKVYTYIGGGPESALFKSTDGGVSWKKLEGGLPGGELGRIGLAISPLNPDILYAVIEANEDKGGIYRSADKGSSWEKRSGAFTSGNYYQEITCDPFDVNKIYITDTYYKLSYDGGKTVSNLGELNKHIDNHAIWIDPKNGNHLLVGCDGGIFETYDFAKTWEYKSNLPITQFYKVSTDNDFPFYSVHGGTQDNMSLAGPSRTTSANGITNADWYVTSTGDGFETQVDPTDPNIIYAQSQYGGLVRFDRKSGEMVSIKPIERENEAAYRWNWDSPLWVSQHKNTRIYFGANKLFKSEDRGNSWMSISPDLSRQIDRNRLEVMGKVWSVDAVAKNLSTDIYGQLTTVAESKFDENIIWVGTDDGLIQITVDGGKSWKKIDGIQNIPGQSYVHQIIASVHDKQTAFVCFNHHRYGDFKPYVLKTSDLGKTWKTIQGNLPVRGSVYSIAEDHVSPDLLFAGTEFGVFFSNTGGSNWIQLKAGLPTIAVRDIEIQRRENDLVLGTFGRGFYILDDYSVLRNFKKEDLQNQAKIYEVKDSWMFIERMQYGLKDKGHMGAGYFVTPNPKPGAVFTYFLKEDLKSLKEKRQEREKELSEKKQNYYYPNIDSLRNEANEMEPFILFTIKDDQGNVVRHLKAPAKAGLHRIIWDFRYNNQAPIHNRPTPGPEDLFSSSETGHLAMPGKYSVSLSKFANGILTNLTEERTFQCKLLENSTLPRDMNSNVAFYKKVASLRKATSALTDISTKLNQRIDFISKAALDQHGVVKNTVEQVDRIRRQWNENNIVLHGDPILGKHQFETSPSLNMRVGTMVESLWGHTANVPDAYRDMYADAAQQYDKVFIALKKIENEIIKIENELEVNQAPYTPGRWPDWKGK